MQYDIIKITDLETAIEKILRNKVVVGYKNSRMHGHIQVYFLEGLNHYIEIRETLDHKNVKTFQYQQKKN